MEPVPSNGKTHAILGRRLDLTPLLDRLPFTSRYSMKSHLLCALLISVAPIRAADINTLTVEERSAGWELLFDGRSLDGWRGYGIQEIPSGWLVKDGTLRSVALDPNAPRMSGAHPQGLDLITKRQFTDYELTWEWRVSYGANNGLKYFVTESRPSAPGHEYQIMDDYGDPTKPWRAEVHRVASFYDVVPPSDDKPIRPAGVWNISRLVVRGDTVEHWLNGVNVLVYELGSEQVKAGIARSKFKDEPGFGNKITGHILLVATTQPGRECWIRNMKIRELKK